MRGFDTTDSGQATRLRTGLDLLVKDRRTLRIGRVFWYTWLSQEASTGSSFDYSGLRRIRDGQLVDAPALTVFTREARKLEGCAKLLGNAARCR